MGILLIGSDLFAASSGYSTYFIPGDELTMNRIFDDISSGNVANNDMHVVIGVTSWTGNTVLCYDHWEDGYDYDPQNPGSTCDEQVTLSAAGAARTFESSNVSLPKPAVDTGNQCVAGAPGANERNCDYDGADRIFSTGGNITVNRASWVESVGVFQSVAWEVYPLTPQLTSYVLPFGEDLAGTMPDFNRVYATAQAFEDGTVLRVDFDADGTPDMLYDRDGTTQLGTQITLNRGESFLIDRTSRGNQPTLDTGARIEASLPIQVQYVIGDQDTTYEIRGLSAFPRGFWSNRYYAPVTSTNTSNTDVFLFNPHAAAININWETRGSSGAFSIPAGQTVSFQQRTGGYVPVDSAVYLEGSDVFWGISTADTGSSVSDWAYSLVPAELLTSEHFLAWAPGAHPPSVGEADDSGIYISPAQDAIRVFIDFDADGNVDQTYDLGRLETQYVFDANDGDMSNTHIWATGPYAAVYGQNPALAPPGLPAIDVGYTVLPSLEVDTVLDVEKTTDPIVVPTAIGSTAVYRLTITSKNYPVDQISATDALPSGWAYVNGSTTITRADMTTLTGAAADPIGSGWTQAQLGSLRANQTIVIQFTAETTQAFSTGDVTENRISASGTRTVGGMVQTFTTTDFVFNTFGELQVQKASSGVDPLSPGDQFTYTVTVSNPAASAATYTSVAIYDPLPVGTSYVVNSSQVEATTPALRVKEYYLGTGSFSGTTYNLVLDQDLSPNYFVMVRGSAGDGTSNSNRGPDSNYAALTADPFATGDLGNSGSSNVITLSRNSSTDDWIGVVTVVEALGDVAGTGFRLLDVQRVAHGSGSTSGTDASAASWDPAQVMLMGGFKGAGCDSTSASSNQNAACHARIWPIGTNTIGWTRGGATQPGTLSAATSTVMVMEWGTDWTVQTAQVTGSNGGNGVDDTGEYNTVAINPVSRANTWVWGTGHTDYDGLGEAGEGAVVTLGDGVNQNASESSIAVGLEYSNLGLSYQVYALTHDNLAVDYRFKPDGDSASLTVDVAVDTATDNRMAVSYNGQNGVGTAYPRPIFSARYLDDSTVRLERRRSGQDFPAWVQGVDFSAMPTVPVTAAAGSPPNFVVPSDDYSVAPGQSLTLTFDVTVDNPLATGITSLTNVASVTTDQTPVPVTDQVANTVNNPSALTGTVGDRIWLDANGDGVLNVGESGLGNVTLTLRDQFGTPIATTVSDSNGFYTFSSVQAGTGYYVEATSGVPSGLTQSAPGGHSDNRTNSFDLTPGQNYTGADLGYTSTPVAASLGDRVWSDADGDGIQDAGEPGIAGVTVELYTDGGDGIFNPGQPGSDDALVTTTTTAAGGSYLFTGVTATGTEDYWVSATAPAGYTGTTFGAFYYADVNGGDTLLTADFGFQGATTPTYGIADRIWFDSDASGGVDGGENGLAGVSVDLLDASLNVIATVTTDANGYFSFSGVPNGNYTVKVTDTAGVLNDHYGTTTASTLGQYGITNLSADLDNTGTPSFGYNTTRSIGDTVFNDLNGNGVQDPGEQGISGVTVELQDGSCTPGVDCPTVVTDSGGSYLFSGLSDGSYTVSIDGTQSALSGYNLTTVDDSGPGSPHDRNVVLAGGVSQLAIDFGYQAATPTSISGTIWDDKDQSGNINAGDERIQGVTVDLLRNGVVVASTSTDINGLYSFSGLVPGAYSVRLTDTAGLLNGYTTTYELTEGSNNPPYDGEENVTTSGGDAANINFGFYYPKPTLVTVVAFDAFSAENGSVYVSWETASEIGTAGFRVERLDSASGQYIRVNQEPLPALGVMGHQAGGTYLLKDNDAIGGGTYVYRLLEEEMWGSRRIYGPYKITVKEGQSSAVQGMSDKTFLMQSWPATQPASPVQAESKQSLDAAARQYDGGTTQVSFPVRQDGLVFVNLVELQQMTGLSLQQLFASGSVRLANQGQTVSWWPVADGGGYYAYVQSIDSLYALDNVYQLQDGMGSIMAVQSVAPQTTADEAGFRYRRHVEKDNFAATAVTMNPESDYWYWDALMAGNTSYERKSFDVNLRDVRAGIRLQVLLKGYNTKIHTVEISVNGQPVGSDTWFGISEHEVHLSLPPGVLADGLNTVELYATGVSGQGFYLDSIDVVYDRGLIARDGRLVFASDSDQALQVTGFGSDVLNLVDITDPQNPVWLTGFDVSGVPGAYIMSFQATAGHAYLAAEATAVPAVSFRLEEITPWNFTSLDYLVVSPWFMREEAHQLAAYRDRTGLKSAVVYLKDIYRVYGHGIQTPEAIRTFLQDAKTNWQLRYVTLVGAASYDYRNLLGYADSLTPTLMAGTPYGLFSCDTCLADFDADGRADLVIGRIPAMNGSALRQYLAKLSDYEIAMPVDITLMLADDLDVAAGDFSADSDQLAQMIAAPVTVQKIYLDDYAIATEARTDFLQKFNAGVDWLNYVGHGADDRLTGEGILTTADVSDLTNTQSAVVTALTCGANRFEFPETTALGEELVLSAHGAVASWAPSGQSLNAPAVALGDTLFNAVFQSGERLLGDAVEIAMQNTGNVPSYMYHIYALLGDSALHLFGSASVEPQTKLSDLTVGSEGGVCNLDSDSTWTAAESPYVMDCDLLIEADTSLVIEPGVMIKSDVGRKIIARGTLQMGDDAGNPVKIRPRVAGGSAPIINFVQEGAGSIGINGMSVSR